MTKLYKELVVKEIADNTSTLDTFLNNNYLAREGSGNIDLSRYPVVYIHSFKCNNRDKIYIGETADIMQRTSQHFNAASDTSKWQHELSADEDAKLYIICHEHFNKSLTLDIENRLIQYMIASRDISRIEIENGRGNPQTDYYPESEFEEIFDSVWGKLYQCNSAIFPEKSRIEDSAFFKASPLHKLTSEQATARELILEKTKEVLLSNGRSNFIFIEGGAGTGKTVLNSSMFYEFVRSGQDSSNIKETLHKNKLDCYLVVNHDEQITVYSEIYEKLGVSDKDNKLVYLPSTFINKVSPSHKADVVFIDEAHLLLTQGNQGYSGKNMLKDIMDRARVVVCMFDANQILNTEQYIDPIQIESYRQKAKSEGNYVELKEQLRMLGGKEFQDWVDAIVDNGEICQIPPSTDKYEIKIFDSPALLENAIKQKAKNPNYRLSRLIATYDWAYTSARTPMNGGKWCVKIGDWQMPWNYETKPELSSQEKRDIAKLAWAEQDHTINEVGSTYAIQGFDLDYAGVILGPSVKLVDGKIVFDPSCSKNKRATQNRTLDNGKKQQFGELFLKNEFNVLMKRGVHGLYIYACDDNLREALKRAAKHDI